MNKEALKKGVVEVGRIILLAFYAWLIAGGVDFIVGSLGMSLDAQGQLIAFSFLVLKGLDKGMHEAGSAKPKDSRLTKGITRF